MRMERRVVFVGYHGMPSFKIRPSKVSMHGRQLAIDAHHNKVMFSVAKRSRVKTMSLRHNLEVSIGDDEKDVRPLAALCALLPSRRTWAHMPCHPANMHELWHDLHGGLQSQSIEHFRCLPQGGHEHQLNFVPCITLASFRVPCADPSNGSHYISGNNSTGVGPCAKSATAPCRCMS
jgi:hypothetical protein